MSNIAVNIATIAMRNFQTNINSLANDISNALTIGYKKHYVETTDNFYTTLQRADATKPVNIQMGNGSKISGIYRILQQGAPKQTNNPLDIMINGAGYFAVLYNEKPAYTRNGSFKLDNQRRIVSSDGHVLAEELEIPLDVDINTVKISNTGFVTATGPENNLIEIGQINLYTFANERALMKTENGLLVPPDDGGLAVGEVVENIPGEDGAGTILQHHLEESNVDTIETIQKLMETQQAFQIATNIMKTAAELEKELNKVNG